MLRMRVGLLWPLAAVVALAWPGRMAGPLDGMPLDAFAEALVIGLLVPALLIAHPQGVQRTLPRALVVMLFGWKLLTAGLAVQDGWCVRFEPASPIVRNAAGAPHSWDVRADWTDRDPACSAIMTRPYELPADFPAWFFNLPPPNDSWPSATDRPPGATVPMIVSGYLRAPADGVLAVETSRDVPAKTVIDGREMPEIARGVRVAAGVHQVRIDAALTGNHWRLVPLWNGSDVFTGELATVKRPATADPALRSWGWWVTPTLATALVLVWLASFLARIGDPDVLAWMAGACGAIAMLAAAGTGDLARWALAGLAGAVWLPVPRRLRTTEGAACLLGAPWLTMVAVLTAGAVGHFRLYSSGDDWWMFQRYAYRIVMQGYWLEGGSQTFWFQPLYRWIVGLLHLVFGDSSVGEAYWDACCILVTALFSFRVTDAFAGFRWGIAAAASTFLVFTWSNAGSYLGVGLSEVSSAGFLYAAALLAMRSRFGGSTAAVAGGVAAALAFYTRLNALPMAAALMVFALPLRQPIASLWRPATWWRNVWWPTAAAIPACLAVAALFFAWRTWHYTGVFSLFYGTQKDLLAVYQPGMHLTEWLRRVVSSVLMVLTINDPPRFDIRAITVIAAAPLALAAAIGVPRLRNIPAGPVVMLLAALAAAAVARGSAYSGRFSIPIIAVTSTIVACALAALTRTEARGRDDEDAVGSDEHTPGQQRVLQPEHPAR